MARDLATIVSHLLELEQAAFRRMILGAGFTTSYADDPGNQLTPDRTATVGHALLARLLEGA